jgi:hypothetical protein
MYWSWLLNYLVVLLLADGKMVTAIAHQRNILELQKQVEVLC